jgi:hypothetical protein
VHYVSANGKAWEMNRDINGSISEMEYPFEKLPGEWISAKLDSLGRHFKFGPTGTLEPVVITFFAQVLFHDNRFIVPIDYYKTYLKSGDGYSWQLVKWDIDTTPVYNADPFYRATNTFIELRTESAPSPVDPSEEQIRQIRSGCIIISKDRKKWDTITVDQLVCGSYNSPTLRKYPDGLVISMGDKGHWYSADGRKWNALNITKPRTASCRTLAKFNASGNDRKIYIFSDGTAKLSNDSGTQWFPAIIDAVMPMQSVLETGALSLQAKTAESGCWKKKKNNCLLPLQGGRGVKNFGNAYRRDPAGSGRILSDIRRRLVLVYSKTDSPS